MQLAAAHVGRDPLWFFNLINCLVNTTHRPPVTAPKAFKVVRFQSWLLSFVNNRDDPRQSNQFRWWRWSCGRALYLGFATGINFFNCPYLLLLFHDILHLKEALVSSLGLRAVKNTLYINTFHWSILYTWWGWWLCWQNKITFVWVCQTGAG